MNKTGKWILFSLAALVVLFIVVRVVNGRKKDVINVTAEAAKRRTIVETVSASGKLYPENEIRIAPPASGEVTELNVQEGDRVTKGQIIGRIQGDKNASTALPRIALPNVPAGFEGLVQGLQQSRVSLPSSAVIKAPMDGTVLGLSVKKGERVNAMSQDLMRIADLSSLEVRVNVNENDIIKLAVGDSADVRVEAYNKRRFKGVVTVITNGAAKRDAQSLLAGDATTFEVHVWLLPSSYKDLYEAAQKALPFRPGMNASADIKTRRKEGVISVPVGAVVSRPKGSEESSDEAKKEKAADENAVTTDNAEDEAWEEVVFVLKGDTVAKRVVTTGLQDRSYFEITSGLSEGEAVITAPYGAVSKTLRSGKKVSVVSKEKLFETP